MNAANRSDGSDKKNMGARRRLRLLLLALTGFLVWAGLTCWNQEGLIRAKAEQLEQMEQKFQAIKDLNESYQLEVIRLNDSEYIEQMIRKDYGYIRPGETMFDIPVQP